MTLFGIVWREAWHRKGHAFLVLLALAIACALPIFFRRTGMAATLETRAIQNVPRFNLTIVPKDTDLDAFYRTGHSDRTMPEDVARRFATRGDLAYNHLLATLQRWIDWNGTSVLLTGTAQEVHTPGRPNAVWVPALEPSTLHLGWHVARALNVKRGDTVELAGRTFTVHGIARREEGHSEDFQVSCALQDAQAILNLPGQVNGLQAIECLNMNCVGEPAEVTLTRLRDELATIVPEGMLLRHRKVADARARQRQMAETYATWVQPVTLAGCLLIVAFLFLLDVRNRREEIGILRALGHGTTRIVSLFVLKAIALGVLAAFLGFALGNAAAHLVSAETFPMTAVRRAMDWIALLWALLLVPAFAVFASSLPTLHATRLDPADTLRGPP
ncbi:MAG: ABC transporter permease [Planctomycetes bacterium]|nr:ABC transporter permease [Planctomycetota bacterium]